MIRTNVWPVLVASGCVAIIGIVAAITLGVMGNDQTYVPSNEMEWPLHVVDAVPTRQLVLAEHYRPGGHGHNQDNSK